MIQIRNKSQIKLKTVIEVIEKLIPPSLAESWDNVGLLINPTGDVFVENILLTNDLTEQVVDEAIEKKTDLILSYHPPIFHPFKKLDYSNWKDRIVMKCIKNSINVYSSHTAADSIENGVNDWFIRNFKISQRESILPSKGFKDNILGLGRKFSFESAISIDEIIKTIKETLNISNVRVAFCQNHNKSTKIDKAAVCVGSGYEVVKEADVPLCISGEMSHHQILDLIQSGKTVILTEHSTSERSYSEYLMKILDNEFKKQKVKIMISNEDKEFIKIF